MGVNASDLRALIAQGSETEKALAEEVRACRMLVNAVKSGASGAIEAALVQCASARYGSDDVPIEENV